jgi:hypothetical protein
MALPDAADYLGPIPSQLRTYHGTGAYDGQELPGGWNFLVWSEAVGDRLVLVWSPGHDGAPTYLAVLEPGHTFARFERIPAYMPIPDDLVDLAGVPSHWHADDHVRARRFAIAVAQRWVRELREQPAPPPPLDGEAWARHQLAGLKRTEA